MCADDLLILSPSVTLLKKLIRVSEIELTFLDMPINANKSMCIRIGARHKTAFADIIAYDGAAIPWSNVCRYT